MKCALISVSDKLLLRKRAIIATVYVSQNAVYQCTTYIRHTAESILNSSNSRYLSPTYFYHIFSFIPKKVVSSQRISNRKA